MSDVILWDNPEFGGRAAITVPAVGWTAAEVLLKDVPVAQQFDAVIVDAAVIPTDFTFADAWVRSGSTIDIDLVKARPIWKLQILIALAFWLWKLQIDLSAPQWSTLKTEISDANIAIDAALTPAAIKAIWPALLPTLPPTP